MFRKLTAAALAGAVALVLSPAPLCAHEGYPIAVKGDYKEMGRAGSTKRMIFVEGHAHYPDTTRMAIGLRYEGQNQYVVWYNTTVMKQKFVAELGPWTKELSPGQYIIEAWFNFDRQSKSVQALVLKADESVEGGGTSEDNSKCAPEVLAAKKECLSKNMVGACVVMVGTPTQYQMEDLRNTQLLQEALGALDTLRADLDKTVKAHQEAVAKAKAKDKKDKPADPPVDKAAWETWSAEWLQKVDYVDQQLSQWKQSRLVQKDADVYSDMVNVLMRFRELVGQWGTKLYQIQGGDTLIGGDLNPDLVKPEETEQAIKLLIEGGGEALGGKPGIRRLLAQAPTDGESDGEKKADPKDKPAGDAGSK